MRLLILFCFLLSSVIALPAQERKRTTRTQTAQSAQRKKTTTSSQKSTSASRKTTTTKKSSNAKAKTSTSKGKSSASSANNAVPSTPGIRNLQNEQANLKKKMNESQTQLATTRNNVRSQLANLQVINGRITEQKRVVTGIQQEVDTLTHRIGESEQQLRVLEADLAECKRKYSRGVLYMHRNRQTQNKLMFVFSANDFRQMYRRVRYAQEYTKYQRAQGLIVQQKEDAVRQKRDELSSQRNTQTALLAKGKAAQAQLEGQQKEQEMVVNELNKKQKELQATLAQQQRQYNALNQRIEQLIQAEIAAAERRRKAEEARRRAEEERQRREEARRREANRSKGSSKSSASSSSSSRSSSTASSSPRRSSSTPDFRPADNTDRILSNNFAANRGRLPVPITGAYVISSRFGAYHVDGLSNVTLDNKGINLTGQSGAQARSIFDGEVTAVFSLGGFSNVMVRHGSYISVYCNLSSVSVRQGQRVSTRQVLGNVARDANGSCTLHFQLRKETSKLNPESWIAR